MQIRTPALKTSHLVTNDAHFDSNLTIPQDLPQIGLLDKPLSVPDPLRLENDGLVGVFQGRDQVILKRAGFEILGPTCLHRMKVKGDPRFALAVERQILVEVVQRRVTCVFLTDAVESNDILRVLFVELNDRFHHRLERFPTHGSGGVRDPLVPDEQRMFGGEFLDELTCKIDLVIVTGIEELFPVGPVAQSTTIERIKRKIEAESSPRFDVGHSLGVAVFQHGRDVFLLDVHVGYQLDGGPCPQWIYDLPSKTGIGRIVRSFFCQQSDQSVLFEDFLFRQARVFYLL